MAFNLLDTALAFLDAYGLLAVFILLVLDGAMLLPVLPGEIVMIMAVAQYARTPWDLIMLIALATAAAIVGSLLLYAFSRWGGRRLIENHPRLFMMPRRRRERLERAFQKPLGQSLVLFLRVIPLTRVLVNIPAGLARMGLPRFLILSTIGMVVFHAAFMGFAYQYGEPGAGVAEQAALLSDAYASPAWDYMQANQVVTALGLLTLGAVLSYRGSRRVLKDPEEGSGSLIGWLAARVLFWGGIVTLVVLWLDPGIVFELTAAGNLDVREVAAQYGWDPVSFSYAFAGGATFLGLFLIGLGKLAKRRRLKHKWEQQYERGTQGAQGQDTASRRRGREVRDEDIETFEPVEDLEDEGPGEDEGAEPQPGSNTG
ncbi:MAG: VTT domain-containing protein [Candidatus Thermoplasmatota archaeon]|nr:VTT domain-containing protein [Candidatus Thermoplasmatota archaeon]